MAERKKNMSEKSHCVCTARDCATLMFTFPIKTPKSAKSISPCCTQLSAVLHIDYHMILQLLLSTKPVFDIDKCIK